MAGFELGSAEITPADAVVAGSNGSIVFTYTAGHPIDDSGYVKIAFQQVCDFGEPQFDDPTAANYCTVSTTGDCRIFPRYDPKGNLRPWSKALYLQIRFGYLDEGEQIRVVFGDRAGGSPGWRVQSFCEQRFVFRTFVDPIATYSFKELPSSPWFEIVAGEPVRAVCIAPAQVTVGQPFRYHLKLEDLWGNPIAEPQPIEHPGFGTADIEIVTATDPDTGLPAQSNPIEVVADATVAGRFWADFHGQSEETIGTNPIEHYFRFGRDFALLDILGHQGNDFQVTDAFWEKINRLADETCVPGQFVTFPGYEWSANTPLGGDRNVYFNGPGGKITRSSCELLPGRKSRFPDSPTAADLFKNLDGPGPFVFAHVGGRYADVRTHDPSIEVAMEVHSCWGTFEWLLEDALKLGYRVGVCANSDDHKARPGAAYPGSGKFGSYGGLTCVRADRLDRDSVHAAVMARHFYATTGHRPILDVDLSIGNMQAEMGDIVECDEDEAQLCVRYVGTDAVDRIFIKNGLETVAVLRPEAEAGASRRIKVTWSGAEVRGRNRMVTWDGSLSVDGNQIERFEPINFWNPDRQIALDATGTALRWESVTTGGVTGAVLTLRQAGRGTLRLDTAQGKFSCDLAELGAEGQKWELGGIAKEVEIRALPDAPSGTEMTLKLPIRNLAVGDNPIYVKVEQENGAFAWSSPIYLVRS